MKTIEQLAKEYCRCSSDCENYSSSKYECSALDYANGIREGLRMNPHTTHYSGCECMDERIRELEARCERLSACLAKFKLFGSDDCVNNRYGEGWGGRVTLYIAEDKCVSCQHKALTEAEGTKNEKV